LAVIMMNTSHRGGSVGSTSTSTSETSSGTTSSGGQ
jgi:hypothetical protein